ncbi:MAG: hypothetical protein H6760_01275 [Candidatus Nomurabacteria bacterium]|nr:MAG: hypothetical protein H6760_01275 [Candidatus Nomurabacteria bacterium]
MNRLFVVLALITIGALGFVGCGGKDAATKPEEIRSPDQIVQSEIVYTVNPDYSGVNVSWKTNIPTVGRVYYGRTPQPTDYVIEEVSTTQHLLCAPRLRGDALFYFQVQSSFSEEVISAREPSEGDTLRTPRWVDWSPPTVRWVDPREGAIKGGTIDLTVSANEYVVNGVVEVKFFIDGRVIAVVTEPDDGDKIFVVHDFNTTQLTDGLHSFHALATDVNGNRESRGITVDIDNSKPVIYRWDAPRNQREIGNSINLRVVAQDFRGEHVDDVYITLDGQPFARLEVCELRASGVGDVWCRDVDTSTLSPGQHYFGAVSVDHAGNESDPVYIGVIKQ